MKIRPEKASESEGLSLVAFGSVGELLHVSRDLELMSRHPLEGDGDAPEQGDEKNDDAEIEDNECPNEEVGHDVHDPNIETKPRLTTE